MAGSESFDKALDTLSARIGKGPIRGSVEVDQVYARYQHEGLDFNHPRGGQAKYLEQPFYANVPLYMRDLAARVLPDGALVAAMSDVVEDLSGEVFDRAPIEFLDLRASAHPTVRRGGAVVYDRPPMQARLTEAQLRAKSKLRRVGFGDAYAD
jgi:hypothetical protein